MTKTSLLLMNDNLPLVTVKEDEDGLFILEWDDTDPRCAEINNWTEDDWLKAIEEGLMKIDKVE